MALDLEPLLLVQAALPDGEEPDLVVGQQRLVLTVQVLVDVLRVPQQLGERLERKLMGSAERALLPAGAAERALALARAIVAKEAASKAIGTGWSRGVRWRDVVLLPGTAMRLEARALEFARRSGSSGAAHVRIELRGELSQVLGKHRPKGFRRGVTAEVWAWKDGKHILEISTTCEPAEAFQVGVEFRSFLEEHGIDLGAKQETKTKTAMQKFKDEHQKGRRARKTGKAGRRP